MRKYPPAVTKLAMDLACAFEGCSWKEWLGPLIYVCYLILWRKWSWKRQDDHYFVQLLCLSERSFAKASEIDIHKADNVLRDVGNVRCSGLRWDGTGDFIAGVARFVLKLILCPFCRCCKQSRNSVSSLRLTAQDMCAHQVKHFSKHS